MNLYRIFDELCKVTSILADIVRKQQAVIEQHGIEVEDPELEEQIHIAEEILDTTEMSARNV